MTKGGKGMHNIIITNMGTPLRKQGNMKKSQPQGVTQTFCLPRDDTRKEGGDFQSNCAKQNK
jgi:hypothetical protein